MWIRQVYLVEVHYLAMLLDIWTIFTASHEGGVAKIIHICMYTYIYTYTYMCTHVCVLFMCVCVRTRKQNNFFPAIIVHL